VGRAEPARRGTAGRAEGWRQDTYGAFFVKEEAWRLCLRDVRRVVTLSVKLALPSWRPLLGWDGVFCSHLRSPCWRLFMTHHWAGTTVRTPLCYYLYLRRL